MSTSCPICLMSYKEPSAVPCGHVFCAACLSAHIAQTKKHGRATCPSCRKEFHCASPDPQLIPPIINPHVLPSIRRIFIDVETNEVQELKAKIDEYEKEISELKGLQGEFETYKKKLAKKLLDLKADTEDLSMDIKVILELGKADARSRPSPLAGPRDSNTRRHSGLLVSPNRGPTWRR